MNEYPKQVYHLVKEPFIGLARKYGITANQVTVFNHFITIGFGCYFFSRGTHLGSLMGLGVCLINGFLDYLDGDLAKLQKNNNGDLGEWLDSGFDVIIQNIILGAIAIGCFKQGLPVVYPVLLLVGNAASNFVSFFYNLRFGFDSANGSKLFRKIMDEHRSGHNVWITGVIDPTADWGSLVFYTYRYFIVLGAVFNVMPLCFLWMTSFTNLRWIVMYCLYAWYLAYPGGGRKYHILKALGICEARNE